MSSVARRCCRACLMTDRTAPASALIEKYIVLIADWSTLIGRGISRLGSHWSRVLLAPALLCHKEPARIKQNTPLGVFCVPKPLVGGFGCDELVLYGIRELA